jgi:hypothetical protein
MKGWTGCRALWLAGLALFAFASPQPAPGHSITQVPEHDYLTETEAARIRDAESTNQRIHLFLEFAADRLRRFQQQLSLSHPGPRHADVLRDLLEAFAACIDDAAGRVADGRERGEDVRRGAAELKKRAGEFLNVLEKLHRTAPPAAPYADALEDAVDAIRQAQRTAESSPRARHRNAGPHGGTR